MNRRIASLTLAAVLAGTTAFAQQVTRRDISGISTFAQVESTIACGGTTTPEAIREIGRMGFKSVVNLRLASEEGARVDEEGAVVRAAGMKYVHLPFNIQSPDPKLEARVRAAKAAVVDAREAERRRTRPKSRGAKVRMIQTKKHRAGHKAKRGRVGGDGW